MPLSFKELLDAFEFVSFAGPSEHQAFLCKESGQIFFHSEYGDDLEPLPEDIESDRYVEIPHKSDLGLGKRLVFAFAHEHMPGKLEQIEAIFRRKGAYARFKSLLDHTGLLNQWHTFEAAAHERALREWCEAEDIEVDG